MGRAVNVISEKPNAVAMVCTDLVPTPERVEAAVRELQSVCSHRNQVGVLWGRIRHVPRRRWSRAGPHPRSSEGPPGGSVAARVPLAFGAALTGEVAAWHLTSAISLRRQRMSCL